MANEIAINLSMNVSKGNLAANLTRFFFANMLGKAGPSPGAIVVSGAGTDVEFPGLTKPGWALFENLETTGWVEIGIKEVDTGYFYPLAELGAGEKCILKLSRNLTREYQDIGTGTSAGSANKFHLKARDIANASVVISAFDI